MKSPDNRISIGNMRQREKYSHSHAIVSRIKQLSREI